MRCAVRCEVLRGGARQTMQTFCFGPKRETLAKNAIQANIMQTFGLVQAKQANLCKHFFACFCVVRCTVLVFAETVLI